MILISSNCTAESNYKVVCYFTNWAWYRPGKGKFLPEDTDPNLCTHVVYGFTVLDSESLTIKVHDSWADIDNSKYFSALIWHKIRLLLLSTQNSSGLL